MKKQNLKLLATIICVLAAGVCYSCSRQTGRAQGSGQVLEFSEETRQEPEAQDVSDEIQSDTGLGYENAADSELETDTKPAVPFTERLPCYVHVCGEVKRPGVYEMETGERLFQAVERAGGFTKEAAEGYLNLALEVEDGMKITVPSKGWAESRISEEMNLEGSRQVMRDSAQGSQQVLQDHAQGDWQAPQNNAQGSWQVSQGNAQGSQQVPWDGAQGSRQVSQDGAQGSQQVSQDSAQRSWRVSQNSVQGSLEPGIYLPETGEKNLEASENSETGQGESGKVNLNTATKEELMTLKGIGQAKANEIIKYRETHGQFQTAEEIMKIPGIKEGAFEKIKDDVTV